MTSKNRMTLYQVVYIIHRSSCGSTCSLRSGFARPSPRSAISLGACHWPYLFRARRRKPFRACAKRRWELMRVLALSFGLELSCARSDFSQLSCAFIRPLSPIPTPIIYSPLFALRASIRVAPPLSERLEHASALIEFEPAQFFSGSQARMRVDEISNSLESRLRLSVSFGRRWMWWQSTLSNSHPCLARALVVLAV